MEAWKTACELFNEGHYFRAHEAWEHRWTELPSPLHEQIQAMILVCGVRIHLAHQRLGAAERLARLALQRLDQAAAHRETRPWVKIEGARDWLLAFLSGDSWDAKAQLTAIYLEGV